MPHSANGHAANHSCFTCGRFKGLLGLRAACGHPRLPPAHDRPEAGCPRWTLAPESDPNIRTVEDWHVHASQVVPGFVPPPPNAFRSALRGVDIRDHFERAQTDPRSACGALAWELARKFDLDYRMYEALLAMARETKVPAQTRVYLRRLAQQYLQEPGVQEEIARREMRDQAYHRDSDR